MSDRRHRRHLAILLALGLLILGPALAGCSQRGSAAPAVANSDLDTVTVTGEVGSKPEVTVPAPFSVTETETRILFEGKGDPVREGQRVSVQYLGINGTDGKEFDTSWGGTTSTFVLDVGQYLPGLVKGLTGVKVGSRILVAVPPKDGYGVQGSPAVGIGPTDTLVVVVDLLSSRNVLSQATGTPLAPRKGLPTVKTDASGQPTVTVPATDPPSSLVVQPLIRGGGPKVIKAQQVTVQYLGVIWASGKVFDSSWKNGHPSTFAIGVGRVIAGWDLGLVGQPVGSRLLLVIPPDQGYGANGNDAAGITGTDTLVFVVDVLDAS
ncbi:MAG: FKBP-type peptidyl-prolyl cis-trans isomerase [Kineosporiaceae bacterium]